MNSKRTLIIGGLVLALLFALLLPGLVVVGVVVSLGASSAAASPCQSAVGVAAGGPVRLPVTGAYVITSNFGMRFDPVYKRYQLHAGIDFAEIPPGPVVAAASGTVDELVHGDPGRGNYVTISNGAGIRTRYQHLASTAVTLGQVVTAGQVVGVEGSTGASTGAHLHFETLVNGVPQDPRTWFTQNGITVPAKGSGGTAPPPGAGGSAAAVSTGTSSTGPPVGAMPGAVGRWSGIQLVNAGYIIKAGQGLNLDPWAITVGVMTAMGESSLKILDYGDGVGPDSRGLFQQRDGGAWGSYADRMNPTISATNFFKALMLVPDYHNLPPTIAAHNTQHNADPFYYAPFWPDAVQVVATLTADPGLLASLPASGADASCDPTAAAGSGPAAPTGPCPASGNPVEASLTPVARNGARCVLQAFPVVKTLYAPGAPAPAHGTTVDLMLPDYRTTSGRTTGWQIADWLRDNAASLGVTAVVFDMKTWTAASHGDWAPYTAYGAVVADDTLACRDHLHVVF